MSKRIICKIVLSAKQERGSVHCLWIWILFPVSVHLKLPPTHNNRSTLMSSEDGNEAQASASAVRIHTRSQRTFSVPQATRFNWALGGNSRTIHPTIHYAFNRWLTSLKCIMFPHFIPHLFCTVYFHYSHSTEAIMSAINHTYEGTHQPILIFLPPLLVIEFYFILAAGFT